MDVLAHDSGSDSFFQDEYPDWLDACLSTKKGKASGHRALEKLRQRLAKRYDSMLYMLLSML